MCCDVVGIYLHVHLCTYLSNKYPLGTKTRRILWHCLYGHCLRWHYRPWGRQYCALIFGWSKNTIHLYPSVEKLKISTIVKCSINIEIHGKKITLKTIQEFWSKATILRSKNFLCYTQQSSTCCRAPDQQHQNGLVEQTWQTITTT